MAKFDRHDTGEVRRTEKEKEKVGPTKGADESLKKDGVKVPTKHASPKSGVESTLMTGSKTQGGCVIVPEKDGSGHPDGVRVGDIVVKLGARQERGARKDAQKTEDGLKSKEVELPYEAAQEK
ncbi:hypothetical protein A2U01_0057434, partial [Trifolium medium]|nr:hypothetical protein [Trifolium medium]